MIETKQLFDGLAAAHRVINALSLLGLASCGGSSGSSSSGALTLNLTDAPIDGATSVIVAFTGIDLQSADGSVTSITFPSAQYIGLLKLQGAETGVLTQQAGWRESALTIHAN